jgi:hypothetical protein
MAHKITFVLTDNEYDYLKHMGEEDGETWKEYATHLFSSRLWEDREINDVWHNNEE